MIGLFLWMPLASPVLAAADPPAVRRIALVAGANDGGPERMMLQYATRDAETLAGVLVELGGVAPGDANLLLDPDRAALERAFDQLGSDLEQAAVHARRTEVLVYYSGHADDRGLLLGSERFTYAELRSELEALPADVRIAVVDACASGALVRDKGGTPVQPFLLDESTALEGHAILTSSSADEAAQEADRIEASFFTHALVTGLRGGADVNGDALVTLNEAYHFAYSETLARTEVTARGPQHPAYDIQLTGTGDLVMTDLRATSAGLVLGEALGGRFFVRDSDNNLVAELFKPEGRSVDLGLPPGDYRVTLESEGQLFRTELTLRDGARTPLGPDDLLPIGAEQTVARGDNADAALDHVPVMGGLWPSFHGRKELRNFEVNLMATRSTDLKGLALTLGGTIVERDSTGLQAALIFNAAGRNAQALQLALGANLVGGDLDGFQGAVGVNVVGRDVRGLQAAVGGNFAGGDVWGSQWAVGLNVAPDVMFGVQAAVGLNWATDLRGGQLGLLNLAGRARGFQFGLVNVANDIEGLQVGLVNIAKANSGFSLGLFNFSLDGLFHAQVWSSDTSAGNVAVQLGTQRAYTLIGLAYSPWGGPSGTWAPLLGWGLHFERPRLYWELDAMAFSHQPLDRWESNPNLVTKLRVTLGVPVLDRFAVFGGLSANVHVPYPGSPSVQDLAWANRLGETDAGREILVWPGAFGGVRF